MHDLGIAIDFGDLPGAAAPDRVELGFERWREALDKADDPDLTATGERLDTEAGGRAILTALFGNSPFLTQCAVQEPAFLHRLVHDGPDSALAEITDALGALRLETIDRDTLAAGLRRAKRRTALTTAVADIAGTWPWKG